MDSRSKAVDRERYVIYDGSVSPRLMPFGWRIQWDNQHNFLEDQNEYSQKWNKCSMTWNLIQVRNQFADTFHLENPVLICSSSTLNTFQSYRTECEISDHYPARTNTQRIHFSSVCTMLMLTNHLFAINTSLLWVAMVTEFNKTMDRGQSSRGKLFFLESKNTISS